VVLPVQRAQAVTRLPPTAAARVRQVAWLEWLEWGVARPRAQVRPPLMAAPAERRLVERRLVERRLVAPRRAELQPAERRRAAWPLAAEGAGLRPAAQLLAALPLLAARVVRVAPCSPARFTGA
jgi:hypothetical protein